MDNSQLAGFGNRLVAQIIDGIILSIALSLLMIPFGGIVALIGLNADNISDSSDEAAATLIGLAGLSILILILFSLIAPFIYEAFMISSAKQATVGKIIMKVKVVGPTGERLTFGQAVGRSLIKYVSGHLCFLLLLWPLFNPEEQALHDLAIKSYVVKSA